MDASCSGGGTPAGASAEAVGGACSGISTGGCSRGRPRSMGPRPNLLPVARCTVPNRRSDSGGLLLRKLPPNNDRGDKWPCLVSESPELGSGRIESPSLRCAVGIRRSGDCACAAGGDSAAALAAVGRKSGLPGPPGENEPPPVGSPRVGEPSGSATEKVRGLSGVRPGSLTEPPMTNAGELDSDVGDGEPGGRLPAGTLSLASAPCWGFCAARWATLSR
eukprot:scaffold12829_cov116-Isochrysis_galbana.AAC.19